MKERVGVMDASPGIIQARLGLERQVREFSRDTRLLDLVRMRTLQINGCACCLDMHSKKAGGYVPGSIEQLHEALTRVAVFRRLRCLTCLTSVGAQEAEPPPAR